MEKSRTQNSILNVKVVIVIQIINFIIGLISRTFFIHFLGNDYLSLNGLFTNILTLLAFSELGIGNAIIFSLYHPIAQNDENKICEILNLLNQAYKIIALFVGFLGCIIIPFLDILVSDVPAVNENIIFIYLLFLLKTVFSYVFSYKKALLIADQRNYIVIIIQQIVSVIQVAVQIFFLYQTKSYIGYLIIEIICTFVINILTTLFVNNNYIYVKKICSSQLPLKEKREIYYNIKSLFLYKLGAALLTGTDNIIISLILTTSLIGRTSNYLLIINTFNRFLMQIFNGLAASIGNHNVSATNKEKEKKFRELNVLCYFVFSITAICLSVLLNPLIKLWLGSEYVLDQNIVLALCAAYYITGTNQIASLYRTTMGLFRKLKFVPIIAAMCNMILSVVFGKMFGLFGIFFATIVTKVFTFSLFDPLYIYHKGFEMKVKQYYYIFTVRTIFAFFIYEFVYYFTLKIYVINWNDLIIKTILCFFITVGLVGLVVFWNKDFKDVLKILIEKIFYK